MGKLPNDLLVIAIVACTSFGCSASDEEDKSGVDERGNFGLYLMVRNPDVAVAAGRACPTSTGVEWDIGNPAPRPSTSPVSGSPGNPVSGASCFVKSDGKFHVKAEGTDPLITPPGGQIQIEFEGTASAGGSMSAAVYTYLTMNLTSASRPCTIGTVLSHGAEELWADFDCPVLDGTDSPAVGCRASGTLVLASCGNCASDSQHD